MCEPRPPEVRLPRIAGSVENSAGPMKKRLDPSPPPCSFMLSPQVAKNSGVPIASAGGLSMKWLAA